MIFVIKNMKDVGVVKKAEETMRKKKHSGEEAAEEGEALKQVEEEEEEEEVRDWCLRAPSARVAFTGTSIDPKLKPSRDSLRSPPQDPSIGAAIAAKARALEGNPFTDPVFLVLR